ncbi:2258_t:CDS:2, partial [Gigaspora rosea]
MNNFDNEMEMDGYKWLYKMEKFKSNRIKNTDEKALFLCFMNDSTKVFRDIVIEYNIREWVKKYAKDKTSINCNYLVEDPEEIKLFNMLKPEYQLPLSQWI